MDTVGRIIVLAAVVVIIFILIFTNIRIVPTDAVNAVKANVLFSETTGLGDVTPEGEEEPVKEAEDPCCDPKK